VFVQRDATLQIVPEGTLRRVRARFDRMQRDCKETGNSGAANRHLGARYLLTGFVYCESCGATAGGRMIVQKSAVTHRRRDGGATRSLSHSLHCNRHRRRGPAVCRNNRNLPMEALGHELLERLKEELVSPDRLDLIVRLAKENIEARRAGGDNGVSLRRKLRDVEGKIKNLVTAIETGAGPIDAVVGRLRVLEGERDRLGQELAEIGEEKRPATVPDLEARIRRKLEQPVRMIAGGEGLRRMREFLHTIGLKIEAGPRGPVSVKADFAPLFGGWSALRTDSGAGNRI
ncbi:MAG: recombinase zinc beta ribbon domain-containing protein, partial [Planctomycetota bacterium]